MFWKDDDVLPEGAHFVDRPDLPGEALRLRERDLLGFKQRKREYSPYVFLG